MLPVRPLVLFVVLLVSATAFVPPASAGHGYDQAVWFTWNKIELSVYVAGVNDPVLGNAIRHAIDRWVFSIEQHAAPWLAESLKLHVYNPALDPVPPPGFQPTNIDIVVAPQGFVAVHWLGKCTALAPMAAGWGSLIKVVMHEFGHCLGLAHIFTHGQEYAPSFDVMGGAVSGPAPCPSNLNLRVLERVFGGQFGLPSGGALQVSTTDYDQPPCT